LLPLVWIEAACVVANDVSWAVAVRAGVFSGAVAIDIASEEGEVAGKRFVPYCQGSAGEEEKQLHVLCSKLKWLSWMDDDRPKT
jgi:hypothetical protein